MLVKLYKKDNKYVVETEGLMTKEFEVNDIEYLENYRRLTTFSSVISQEFEVIAEFASFKELREKCPELFL